MKSREIYMIAADAILEKLHAQIVHAERTDVHLFLRLTAMYAELYCLKLGMMK